jgi:hypothetical protein
MFVKRIFLMKIRFLSLILLSTIGLMAQSAYTNQSAEYNHFVDRFDILGGFPGNNIHTNFKQYLRKDLKLVLDSLQKDSAAMILSKVDKFNIAYLKDDNWDLHSGQWMSRKPVLKYFYQKKNALYAVDQKYLKLIVNPVISVWAGKETKSDKSYNYQNTRGLELRGTIDEKVSFYTSFTDNQAMLPGYVRASLTPIDTLKPVLMGENYIKTNSKGGVDYISARGYVNFKVTKHIGLQFGHDKNFVGNGYRSLILSDNSGNYNFLKLETKIWKIKYTNLFCQLTAFPTPYDSYFPKKYFTLHHLSTNIGKHLNIGVYESVIYGNRGGGGLDINYLNPIIFYRSVEQNLGSSDNASLGMDWKLNFLKHFSWYGQVVIDEFLIKNIRARNGSWTNKQAFQTGLKYMNAFGIHNLDLQAELNSVRPYTYSHLDNYRSYTNYLQPLAHPRGANFKELVGLVRFQPIGRLMLTGKAIYIKQGLDSLNNRLSSGSDLLQNYSQRLLHSGQADIGHKIGQGIAVNLYYIEFNASYMVKHNIFLDLTMVHRKQTTSYVPYKYNSTIITLGLRMNIGKKSYDW